MGDPDAGLDPGTLGSCPEPKADAQPQPPRFPLFKIKYFFLFEKNREFYCVCLFFFLRFYLFIYERHRERYRQREKQAPCKEPDVGLDLGLQYHTQGQRQALNRWATRAALFQTFWTPEIRQDITWRGKSLGWRTSVPYVLTFYRLAPRCSHGKGKGTRKWVEMCLHFFNPLFENIPLVKSSHMVKASINSWDGKSNPEWEVLQSHKGMAIGRGEEVGYWLWGSCCWSLSLFWAIRKPRDPG